MRIGTIRADAGIEMQLTAALASGLLLQPRHDRVGVTPAAQGGARDEVVDIQKPAPSKVVADTEACDCGGVRVPRLKRCGHTVARSALSVDPRDQFVREADVPAKLEQSDRRPMRFAGLQFTDLGHVAGFYGWPALRWRGTAWARKR